MHSVRLAVFGAPAVGKTALIEVLVSHCVQPLRPRTAPDRVYSLTALFDGIIYYVTLLDVHSDLTCARPVTADAYLLMFDLTSPGQSARSPPTHSLTHSHSRSSASFQYVRVLRDQLRLFDNVAPVFVVGNKADCIVPAAGAAHPEHAGHHYSHADLPVAFKELSALIRKQWKWPYAEVSAARDWHVHALFRRVLQSVSQHSDCDSAVPTSASAQPQRLSAPPARSPHCRLL